jgi:hypothetical protein
MPTREEIEKVRQEVMRFHELLEIMRAKVEESERVYTRLFANLSAEDRNLKEKDQQWKVAEQLIADPSPLQKAVISAQFNAREMERAFEELYHIIITDYETDDE